MAATVLVPEDEGRAALGGAHGLAELPELVPA